MGNIQINKCKEYEDECKYIITHDVDINPKKKLL